jgi:hypothetical protein
MSRTRAGGLTALVVTVTLLIGALLHFGHLPQAVRPSAEPEPPPSMHSSQASVTGVSGTATGAAAKPVMQRWRTASALRMLRAWDARRAAAYATGSSARLSRLYIPGSEAGAADERLLDAYRSRGLRVAAMRTQLLAVEVLEADPSRWVIRVQDRLAHAVAVAVGDRRRRLLPRDDASTRTVTLLHSPDGRWRVSSVLDD